MFSILNIFIFSSSCKTAGADAFSKSVVNSSQNSFPKKDIYENGIATSFSIQENVWILDRMCTYPGNSQITKLTSHPLKHVSKRSQISKSSRISFHIGNFKHQLSMLDNLLYLNPLRGEYPLLKQNQ